MRREGRLGHTPNDSGCSPLHLSLSSPSHVVHSAHSQVAEISQLISVTTISSWAGSILSGARVQLHTIGLTLKAAAGAFAAARFDVLRGGSVGGADGASPAPVSELSRLPSALRVWLFAQRSPLPLHLLAAEGSGWSVEGSASEVSAEVSAG